MNEDRPLEVAIVGAGFAGLRCADILLQHGCKVTIFEARDRIGGRVAQSSHLGHLADLGANWIHGTKNNPIADLAEKTGTIVCGWDGEEVLVDPHGNVVDATEAAEYAALLWDDGLIAEAFRLSEEQQDSIDPTRSLYDFFKQKVESLFQTESAEEAKRKRATLLLVSQMWGAYIGSPVHTQSLKYFWLGECIEGENPFVAETYGKILDAVAKAAWEGAEIHLRTKVTAVEWPSEENESRRPRIKTAKGILEFDEIVMTAPLGWLKRNLMTFQPSLPMRITQAIQDVGYGTLDKVYITFPAAFWDTPTASASSRPSGLDPDRTTPNLTATTAPLHQPARKDAQHHYAGFTHWVSPAYAPDTNPEGWDIEGMNLAALPDGCDHPTLLFYIYGPCSQHIADIVANAKSEQERDECLLQFFHPYYSMLPNFDEANSNCKPKAVLATAWARDEFAGFGSYSNFPVGLEHGAADIEAMRHGLPEGHLWFAGEHTAPFESSGTTTGAYVSGEAVARRILRAHDSTD